MDQMSTPHFPTDYDQYAPTYAWARSAFAWVLAPLRRAVNRLPAASTVLEPGCGTGNYVCALGESRPGLRYVGLDLSGPMLHHARARRSPVRFVRADAAVAFPFRDATCALVFAVDVVHHLDSLPRFFQEVRRVLGSGGRLIIVTDSEQTMRERSLTAYFPDVLAIEQRRYPTPGQLQAAAGVAGLRLEAQEQAVGDVPLSDEFVARLAAKCSSALRLLPPDAHAAGMARVRAGQAQGRLWRSHYLVLHYAT